MLKLLLSLMFLITLASAKPLPYTLENLKKLNLYYVDRSGLFSKKEQQEIKKHIKSRLQASGFDLHADDPSTLVVKIQTIDIDDSVVAYIALLVGEEVITKRDGNIETMALTYQQSDFLELDDPEIDIKEVVYRLLEEFLQLYSEDME